MASISGLDLVSQGTAYGLLIGLGVLFCVVILGAVRVQKSYSSEDSGTSEMFMVANRNVGTVLTAAAVFSSWMWINETVLCATMCYRYGLAVPLWWGSGLCFQIALMAALGVMAKIRVPYAHTSLEVIRQRYGKIGHLIFIVLNLVNNVFGCASMILTGSQLVYGVSGMHFVAACILIPMGVVVCTAVGGLKATFLTDFLHTFVALILIIYFTLSVLTHDAVGGLSGLYDKVLASAAENYIPGNYKGSLLTMKSENSIIWGLDLKFGNLALVIMDTAFWQKSFATEVNATVPGYNLAALAIFGIPCGLGTVIGLTARALHSTPISPMYPGDLTLADINAGFVMPYTIQALLGTQGVVAFLVLVFMALTSTVSSSMIAVSSILSFDVYKTYLNPKVTDAKLVRVSHLTVVLHGAFMSAVAIALNYGGANVTWLGYFRPVLSCSGIIPSAFTLGWSRQTKLAAVLSPVLGFLTGLAIWLATTYRAYGSVTIDTTTNPLQALYGAMGSFLSPALYSVALSLMKPSKFDWREVLRVEVAEDIALHKKAPKKVSRAVTSDDEKENNVCASGASDAESPSSAGESGQQATQRVKDGIVSASEASLDDIKHPFDEATLKKLRHWERIAWVFLVVVVLVTFVAWPLPLYRDYSFTKSFFSGWTTVAIMWQFFAFAAVVVFPVYDGRHAIAKGARGVWHSFRS
ncbi:unnamed protein product [Discula destructiva]